jgi:Arc/MetJ-type ribon-helix-helix transcriptional regulator
MHNMDAVRARLLPLASPFMRGMARAPVSAFGKWCLPARSVRGIAGRTPDASTGQNGMVFGVATAKITITLPDDQVEEIRALVAAGRAASVSAFVKHAVGVALHDAAGWREMLEDALEQTGGPLTKKERAWADALLSPAPRKKRSGKGKAA